jgi:hypothetical protein
LEDGPILLRGVVEHVGSGSSGPFQGDGELIDLILVALGSARGDGERKEADDEITT